MTSLIMCLLLSGAVAPPSNRHKIDDIIIMISRFYDLTSSAVPHFIMSYCRDTGIEIAYLLQFAKINVNRNQICNLFSLQTSEHLLYKTLRN